MSRCTLRSWAFVAALAIASALLATRADAAVAQADDPSEEALLEARVHYQAGKIYFDKQKYRQAITEFEAGYELVKKSAFLVNIAQCHRLVGDAAKARKYYQQFLDEDPDSPQAPQVEALVAELDTELGDAAAEATAEAATGPEVDPEPEPAPPPPRADPEALAAALDDEPAPGIDEEPEAGLASKKGDDRDKDARPFYAKPWFWTVVGLVVVGGTAGAYFATREPGYVSEGSLGNIDARRNM